MDEKRNMDDPGKTAKMHPVGDEEMEEKGKDEIRPKEEVREDVMREAAEKLDVGEGDGSAAASLDAALDKLYGEYEGGGDRPTQEALAEALRTMGETGLADVVAAMPYDPFVGKPKSRKTLIIGIALAVVAVIAVAVIGNMTLGADKDAAPVQTPQASTSAMEETEEDDSEEAAVIALEIEAEGWSDESTPVIVHIEGDEVDYYTAIPANEEVTLKNDLFKAGSEYTVTIVSPINPDGSIYKVPEPLKVKADVEKKATSSTSSSQAKGTATLEPIPAKDVTQEDLDKIFDQIKDAVSKGDDTLSGDAGQTVIDKAAENAAENPNADAEKVEEKKEETSQAREESDSSGSSAAGADSSSNSSAPSGNSSKSDASSSSGSDPSPKPANSGSSNSSGSSSSSSGNSSSGSSNSGSGNSSSKPAHTHSWVEQTTQQWVAKDVYVVDKEAWTETITKSYILCSCGATFNSNREWSAHNEADLLNGGEGHSYSVKTETQSIPHGEEGHWEDQGHYKTVVTGYKCSTCGATK